MCARARNFDAHVPRERIAALALSARARRTRRRLAFQWSTPGGWKERQSRARARASTSRAPRHRTAPDNSPANCRMGEGRRWNAHDRRLGGRKRRGSLDFRMSGLRKERGKERCGIRLPVERIGASAGSSFFRDLCGCRLWVSGRRIETWVAGGERVFMGRWETNEGIFFIPEGLW